MDDVLVVGAGPAGSIAALVLVRAGARVRIVDRAEFPRDKLCGDTVNPGTIAVLRRLGVVPAIEARGLPVRGMRVTGPNGVAIEGRYPDGLTGRALLRRDLDWILLERAMAAGAQFEAGIQATGARVNDGAVTGVNVRSGGRVTALAAPVTIAADGRRSTIAFGLHLARHPSHPRRWAIGAYFEGVADLTDVGEMHVRPDLYIGVAPVPGGATNVCVVTTLDGGALGDPAAFLERTLAADRLLGPRTAASRRLTRPAVLGPLAVEATGLAPDGLLIAGDAAGFIDPMTGDGLRFAVRGGELAAAAALDALADGWHGVHARHAAARRDAFAPKWRFNRALRSLVAAPDAVSGAARLARVAPGIVRAIVRRAGDCARS